ncbi:uncharacterized protein V2V93DRAFT_385133 [Kockiozyma suomiensis]|uniref:uncharacterized protein n=1 Tax=Kockiozyma suomiensis TaxID=1337062 RepID=UPI0033431F26
MSLETAHRDRLVRLLNISILRDDTEIARRALALLLRTRAPPPRTRSVTTHTLAPFWTQMLAVARSPREKSVLLEWLLVSLGAYLRLSEAKLAASATRRRVRDLADSLYPALVVVSIERGEVLRIVDRLEEVMLEWPFSEDARLRRYYGMGLISLGRVEEGVAELEKLGLEYDPDTLMGDFD